VRYADKAVLKTLQQQFVRTMQFDNFQNPDEELINYDSLTPEKALKAIVEEWKAKYNEEIKEEAADPKPNWTTFWEIHYNNTIPFMNETLLQLQTTNDQYLGGAHGVQWFSCHLFNLQTGEKYSRDDIFKPEASARIHRLLIAALLNYWEVKSPREISFMEEEVWTKNTDFAVTPEGVAFLYSDYELGSYALGNAEVTIPYAAIFPYLREGTPVWYVAKEMIPEHSQEVIQEIDEDKFVELIDEIYYKLPASVMPDYLKTTEQRKDTNISQGDDISINCLEFIEFDGGGGYEKWTMAAYLTEDKRNVLLIVQYGGGLDGYMLQSDKTLNYNIETGRFAEIERPIDPFTVDEMIDENHFDDPELASKAKAYFIENQKLFYRGFDKNGFNVIVDFFEFWLDNEDFDNEAYNNVVDIRKWNGKRFVKSDRKYLHDYEEND
jgi:hypothetical protein